MRRIPIWVELQRQPFIRRNNQLDRSVLPYSKHHIIVLTGYERCHASINMLSGVSSCNRHREAVTAKASSTMCDNVKDPSIIVTGASLR